MTTRITKVDPKSDTAETKPTLSPEALLKAVVSGGKAEARIAARRLPAPILMAVGGGALALGLICGAGLTAASLQRPPERTDGLAEVHAGIDAARTETARVATEIERLARTMAAVQDAVDAGRKDAAGRGATLAERVAKVEQAVSGKVAALSERVEQAEREAAGRFATLAGQIEKQRAAVPAPVAPVAAKPEPVKIEPVQTGSIEPKKDKPAIIETWAVRDVFDGMAVLEDRRRRLVEVGPGGAVPGIGRVEGIERRGRDWVVVTRQGLITPQAW